MPSSTYLPVLLMAFIGTLAVLACPALSASPTPSPLQWEEIEKSSEDNTLTFQAVNTSADPIRIISIQPSCTCLTLSPSSTLIPPGGTFQLKTSKHPPEKEEFRAKILILADDPNDPRAAFWAEISTLFPKLTISKENAALVLNNPTDPQVQNPSNSAVIKAKQEYLRLLVKSKEESKKFLEDLGSFQPKYSNILKATYSAGAFRQAPVPGQSLAFGGSTFSLKKEFEDENVREKEYYLEGQTPTDWEERITLTAYKNNTSTREAARKYIEKFGQTTIRLKNLDFPKAFPNPKQKPGSLEDSIIQLIRGEEQVLFPEGESAPLANYHGTLDAHRFFSYNSTGTYSILYSERPRIFALGIDTITNLMENDLDVSLHPDRMKAAETHLKKKKIPSLEKTLAELKTIAATSNPQQPKTLLAAFQEKGSSLLAESHLERKRKALFSLDPQTIAKEFAEDSE